MPRDYKFERDSLIIRWYGRPPKTRSRRPASPIVSPDDTVALPLPYNNRLVWYGYCLAWLYSLTSTGYGRFTFNGENRLAHRVAYIQTQGEIPDGLQVNHLYNRPYCIQPSHLYAGTQQDNIDDLRISTDQDLGPLLPMLKASNRRKDVEPWEPREHPAQTPLEEFTCPQHDFAIPAGDAKLCRICDLPDSIEPRMMDTERYEILADICPVTQNVDPILNKAFKSSFLSENNKTSLIRIHRRQRSFTKHNPRTCECRFCQADRTSFREALDPDLTPAEKHVLDSCEDARQLMFAAFQQAASDAAEHLPEATGMTEEQLQQLRDHWPTCLNSSNAMLHHQAVLEQDLGYLLHAYSTFQSTEDMSKDNMFEHFWRRLDLFHILPEDQDFLDHKIVPHINQQAIRIYEAFLKYALQTPGYQDKPKHQLLKDTTNLAACAARKASIEYLRMELLGRNSSSDQTPSPHAGCARAIKNNQPLVEFPKPFQEGEGYKPNP